MPKDRPKQQALQSLCRPCLSLIAGLQSMGTKIGLHWALWHTPVIPVLRRQRQENHRSQASLGYMAS